MDKLKPEKQIVGLTSQQQEIITELHNEHYDMLFKYAYKILQNEDEANKVVNETFVTVRANIKELQQNENIANYLINNLQIAIIGYLYETQYDMLFNYVRSLLFNEDVSKEVLQETFRFVCENLEKLFQSDNIIGWIVKTLQFSIKRYKRQKQTMSKYIAQVPDDFDFENIVDERLLDEDVKILYSDLAKHKDFDLLTEFAVDGKPIKEIAEKRHISIDACTQKLSRIKKVFRDKISKDNK